MKTCQRCDQEVSETLPDDYWGDVCPECRDEIEIKKAKLENDGE